MTRFVLHATAVLQLASEEFDVAGGHELVAPTLLRSQTLSGLHEAVHRGVLPPEVLAYLDMLREVGLSDRLAGLERDGWIVLAAKAPDRVAGWITKKNADFADPDGRDLYLRFDKAFDWAPDDPRLEELADDLVRFLRRITAGSTPGPGGGERVRRRRRRAPGRPGPAGVAGVAAARRADQLPRRPGLDQRTGRGRRRDLTPGRQPAAAGRGRRRFRERRYRENAWNSAIRTWVRNGLLVAQSVAAVGSASCSPA